MTIRDCMNFGGVALTAAALVTITGLFAGKTARAQCNPSVIFIAATFTVDSTADAVDTNPGNGVCADASGNCTLRAAIMEANAHPGVDVITFLAPAGTYTLAIRGNDDAAAAGDLDITESVIIRGAGANKTIIDAAGATGLGDRVLDIHAGVTAVISDLTITGGFAEAGAGVLVEFGPPAGTLILNNSTVRGNTSYSSQGIASGGGIWSHGTLCLNSSTVSGNTAVGGIWGWGGGIMSYHGSVTLNNSTVSGNVAKYGGGIMTSNLGIALKLSNSTISGNSGIGGGFSLGEYTTMTLKNTIVAGNSGVDCAIGPTDILVSLGHNLDSDGTCGLNPLAPLFDLPNTNPELAPLA